MLKKLSVLLLLSALCIWAADFWTTKPFTDWNEKEVAKMLSGSPWAEQITISGGVGRSGAGSAEAAGAGRGRGGGGGGRGGSKGGDDASGDSGAGGNGGDIGGGGGIPVTLVWQTAMPVKQALIKRQYGAEAATSPEAKAKLDRVEQFYVLTLIGMPGFALESAQGDRKAGLLDSTMLNVSGKPPLKAVDVQVAGGRGTATMSFVFPKTTTFTAEDKDLEFSTKFDKTPVKKKFKLKDMVFNGKVEM